MSTYKSGIYGPIKVTSTTNMQLNVTEFVDSQPGGTASLMQHNHNSVHNPTSSYFIQSSIQVDKVILMSNNPEYINTSNNGFNTQSSFNYFQNTQQREQYTILQTENRQENYSPYDRGDSFSNEPNASFSQQHMNSMQTPVLNYIIGSPNQMYEPILMLNNAQFENANCDVANAQTPFNFFQNTQQTNQYAVPQAENHQENYSPYDRGDSLSHEPNNSFTQQHINSMQTPILNYIIGSPNQMYEPILMPNNVQFGHTNSDNNTSQSSFNYFQNTQPPKQYTVPRIENRQENYPPYDRGEYLTNEPNVSFTQQHIKSMKTPTLNYVIGSTYQLEEPILMSNNVSSRNSISDDSIPQSFSNFFQNTQQAKPYAIPQIENRQENYSSYDRGHSLSNEPNAEPKNIIMIDGFEIDLNDVRDLSQPDPFGINNLIKLSYRLAYDPSKLEEPKYIRLKYDIDDPYKPLDLDPLFYMFYYCPGDLWQKNAAAELYNRKWRFSKLLKVWIRIIYNYEIYNHVGTRLTGLFHVFDPNKWDIVVKHLSIDENLLERKPRLYTF